MTPSTMSLNEETLQEELYELEPNQFVDFVRLLRFSDHLCVHVSDFVLKA